MDFNIIFLIFLFTIASAFDFIVYNEEVLLALCFLSFIFYCFNSLGESIGASFDDRAAKFESDLLTTFNSSKNTIIAEFYANLKMQFFAEKFSILMLSLTNYLSVCVTFLEYKSSWLYFQASIAKLNELATFNQNFIGTFQKSSVIQLLYSLVLKKSNNNLDFLMATEATSSSPKFTELKFLSI